MGVGPERAQLSLCHLSYKQRSHPGLLSAAEALPSPETSSLARAEWKGGDEVSKLPPGSKLGTWRNVVFSLTVP